MQSEVQKYVRKKKISKKKIQNFENILKLNYRNSTKGTQNGRLCTHSRHAFLVFPEIAYVNPFHD